MTPIVKEYLEDVQVFRQSASTTHKIVKLNLAEVSHAESLIQPSPAGNCLNWVLGHLVCIYDNVLPMLNQAPVMDRATIKRYDRGSEPVQASQQAIDFPKLLQAWDESSRRVDAGLAALTSEVLDSPAPFSPTKNPDETVRSLLTLVFFHQAYHAGQTGILRRIAGKPGAIA